MQKFFDENAPKKAYPYFADVQNDLLDELNSRVVNPLLPYESLNKTNTKNHA